MKRIRISLVTAGSLKYPVKLSELEKWASKIFKITSHASIEALPNAAGPDWQHTVNDLRKLIPIDPDADFTVALVNAPLPDNYYMRRIADNVGVLSIYQMAEIVRAANFSIEKFILRNAYELAVLFEANRGLVPPDAHTWAHDDVRGCLFDMNADKSDIIFSMHKPALCPQCRGRVGSRPVSPDFLRLLDKELCKIRQDAYFRVVEWVRRHPIFALLITLLSGLAINLAASFIFELLKSKI